MLSVQIGANIQGLQTGLNSAQTSLQGFVSRASASLDGFASQIGGIGQQLSIAFTVPLALIGKSALGAAANFEQTQVAFETMLGSGEKANFLLSKLQETASKSPLEQKDLENSAKTLLNFGVAGNSVVPVLNQLSDISLGNADRFSHLSLAFGQVSATGRLMGQDLNQMINAGFNPLQEISRTTGESMASLKKRMEDGSISVEDVSKAFTSATSEGGRFFNGTAKQALTLGGLFSSMQDSIGIALRGLGNDIASAFNLKELIPLIGSTLKSVSESFSNLSPEIKKAVLIFGGLLVVIPPVLVAIGFLIPVFTAVATAVAAISSPVLLVGAAIAGLAFIVVTNWSSIKSTLTETGIWSGLVSLVQNAFGVIKGIFTITIATIKGIWNYGLTVIKNDTFGIFSVITGVFSAALTTISGIVGIFSNLLQGNFKELGNSMKQTFGGVYNFIITMTEGFVRVLIGSFQKVFELFGADKIVNQFKEASESIKKTFEGFKYKIIADVEVKNDKKAKELGSVDLGTAAKNKPEPGKDDKSKLKEKQETLKNSEKLLSEALTVENSLISQKYEREIAQEKQAFKEKVASINQEKASVQAKHKLLEQLEIQHRRTINNIIVGNGLGTPTKAEGGIQGTSTQNLQTGFNQNPAQSLTDAITRTLPALKAKTKEMQEAVKSSVKTDILSNLKDGVNNSLMGAASSAIGGIGSLVGGLMAGAGSIADAGTLLSGAIGNLFSDIGSQLIKAGVAMTFLDVLKSTPILGGPAMIASGLLLTALGSGMSASASGGGSSGGSSGGSYGGYTPNYGSSNGFSGSGGQLIELKINVNGDLSMRSNKLVAGIDQSIRQTVRTTGKRG